MADPNLDHQSVLNLREEDKVATVLKLLESSRAQIMTWHNQAYVAATTSLGLLLAIAKLWFDTATKTLAGLAVTELGMTAFVVLAYLYLRAAEHNYNGNERNKVWCEYALRLKDEGKYFEGERFYWAQKGDKGMPSRDIPVLKLAVPSVGILLAAASAWTFWSGI